MTLKEKLRHSLTGHLSDEKTEVDVNIAEQIAEEFAIGFLNWYAMYGSWIEENLTTKELLEIYKKEKVL